MLELGPKPKVEKKTGQDPCVHERMPLCNCTWRSASCCFSSKVAFLLKTSWAVSSLVSFQSFCITLSSTVMLAVETEWGKVAARGGRRGEEAGAGNEGRLDANQRAAGKKWRVNARLRMPSELCGRRMNEGMHRTGMQADKGRRVTTGQRGTRKRGRRRAVEEEEEEGGREERRERTKKKEMKKKKALSVLCTCKHATSPWDLLMDRMPCQSKQISQYKQMHTHPLNQGLSAIPPPSLFPHPSPAECPRVLRRHATWPLHICSIHPVPRRTSLPGHSFIV